MSGNVVFIFNSRGLSPITNCKKKRILLFINLEIMASNHLFFNKIALNGPYPLQWGGYTSIPFRMAKNHFIAFWNVFLCKCIKTYLNSPIVKYRAMVCTRAGLTKDNLLMSSCTSAWVSSWAHVTLQCYEFHLSQMTTSGWRH